MKNLFKNKKVLSWALYDWANSAFATTVMAGFFPIFFKKYWSAGSNVTESTLQLGIANSFAGVIIALLAPLLGAIADKGNLKKRFLLIFALLGITMTFSLYFVASGQWIFAVLLYVLAVVGFTGGNIFYDSLIVNVAETKKMDIVSSLGYSLGYLGGGILFALNVAMTLSPKTFGLSNSSEAVRVSFISVAIWWGLFSIPLFLFVKEKRIESKLSVRQTIKAGITQLASTFREIRKLKVVFLFLLGYWFYIDGVDTIIRMAVDYGMSIGFNSNHLIIALLITQFVGFPAALIFGKMGEKIGAKNGIFIGLSVYTGVTVYGYFMDRVIEFYILAVVIGLVQGGVQALSRSFYVRIIPKNKSAEFLGFYNMLGKFAVIIGPVLMGWCSHVTGNPRFSILSIALLFIIGALFLYFVDEKKGKKLAEEM